MKTETKKVVKIIGAVAMATGAVAFVLAGGTEGGAIAIVGAAIAIIGVVAVLITAIKG